MKKNKRDISVTRRSQLRTGALRRWSGLFLLPVVAAFCIGFLYPFLQGLFLSFCEFKTTSRWRWVGLENYRAVFRDAGFLYSFGYTTLYTLVSLVIINVLAFAIACALTRGIRGSNFFRAVFFMPNLIGGIVLGYIWLMLFDGILSQFQTALVLETKYGFWGLVIVMAWQQIGYMMIIYIAGLQAVPEELLEAARLDGANGWKSLWHVTIPNVMPSITICMFLSLTNGFKLYDQNLALTAGSPFRTLENGSVIKTTEMLALNIVSANTSRSKGPGQAKAVVFFLVVAAFGLAQLAATRTREVES